VLLNISVNLRYLEASLSKRRFFPPRLLGPTLFFPFFTGVIHIHIVSVFLLLLLLLLLLNWWAKAGQLVSNLKVHCCHLPYWSVKQ